MKRQGVLDFLNKNADSKYREFHAALVPGTQISIGVRIPVIKDLAKQIAAENWKEYLNELDSLKEPIFYEENVLRGLIIGNIRADYSVIEKEIRKFTPLIDNWAVCDTFCSALKAANKNKEKVFDLINDEIATGEEYRVRFGVVMLLGCYIDQEYIDQAIEIITSIKKESYYVQMAQAWAISVAYVKFPEKTIKVIDDKILDKWTHNKSIQKIIESRRVSNKDKDMLRKMKI